MCNDCVLNVFFCLFSLKNIGFQSPVLLRPSQGRAPLLNSSTKASFIYHDTTTRHAHTPTAMHPARKRQKQRNLGGHGATRLPGPEQSDSSRHATTHDGVLTAPADAEEDDEDEPAAGAEAEAAPETAWSDPDTQSIASRDSDDLSAHRPNRWRGTARSWQNLTEQDRVVVAAMQRTRQRDLAGHLYDAFCLKQQQQQQEQQSGQAAWGPPRYWTAWPTRIRADLPVFDGSPLYPRHDWQDGSALREATFHSSGPPVERHPSGPLAEMLTATILRFAKERFQARQGAGWVAPAVPTAPSDPDTGGGIDENVAADSGGRPAVVSADDERSELLLRPSVRHLLTQVDKLLEILHNTRVATAARDEVSPTTAKAGSRAMRPSADANGSEDMPVPLFRTLPPPSTSRSWERPSSWAPGPVSGMVSALTTLNEPEDEDSEEDRGKEASPAPSETPSAGKRVTITSVPSPEPYRTRGRRPMMRPRRPGETKKQLLIRIARKNHRRIPELSDDEEGDNAGSHRHETVEDMLERRRITRDIMTEGGIDNDNDESRDYTQDDDDDDDGEMDDANDEASVDTRSDNRRRVSFVESTNRLSSTQSPPPPQRAKQRWGPQRWAPDHYIDKFDLRDWSDVMAAAGLSGFSGPVLARAAQRCADLFGQSMELDTLQGTSVGGGGPSVGRVRYAPRRTVLRRTEDRISGVPATAAAASPLEAVTAKIRQAREQRRSSMARRAKLLWKGPQPQGPAPKAPEKKTWYCPQKRCPRSTDGFPRRSNMLRHIMMVHSIDDPDGGVDSNDDNSSARGSGSQVSQGGMARNRLWYCTQPGCPRATEGFSRRLNMVRHLKAYHNFSEPEVNEEDDEDESTQADEAPALLRRISASSLWVAGAEAEAEENA